MKKLVLFTYRPEIEKIYYDDLYALLGNYLELQHYALNEGETPTKSQLENANIILVSNEEIINQVYHLIDPRAKIIVIDFGYPEMNLEQMRKFPSGTYALACFNPFVCRKMISLFYEYGINNFIWIIPQQEGVFPESGYDVAVVDDYSSALPPANKEIISLGQRRIAFSTLLKIAQGAGIFNKDLENEFLRYCYCYKSSASLVNSIYGDMSSFHSQVRLILNYIDSGIAILNEELHIVEYNTHFSDLFRLGQPLYGKSIRDIPELNRFISYIESGSAVRNELIICPDLASSLSLSVERIQRGISQGCNYMLILEEMDEIEDKSSTLKRQLKSKGYTSKYRFSDLKTNSPEMLSCIKKAERIATIDKTTLIVGESGTGKELMAQSIHSASKRRNYPFVSINCAALPPSLLESELFGYTDGAFTGSKKGGKPGLFEMANYGTLFLDEIGEASLEVQSKLLRAIETKEIMRLGGDKITSVDVRILAATNQNLDELVEAKKFRLDLYYRLNSIIIKLPPLRARTNDILYLAEGFIRGETHGQRTIEPELQDFLKQYPWKGNIRELKNVIEYMVNITDGPLTPQDLPDYILEHYDTWARPNRPKMAAPIFTQGQSRREPEAEAECPGEMYPPLQPGEAGGIYQEIAERYPAKEIRLILFFLQQIKSGVKSRKSLVSKAEEWGKQVSDYRTRKILDDLKDWGLISYSRGPSGIALSERGQALIQAGTPSSGAAGGR